MKTKIFALILFVSVLGCDDDDELKGTIDSVSSILMHGTWRITYFWDSNSGHEESSHYTGFNFTFSAPGDLTAGNGTTTYTGSWLVTDSDSQHD